MGKRFASFYRSLVCVRLSGLSVPAIDSCISVRQAAVGPAGGRRYRSIAAWPALSSNGAAAARQSAAKGAVPR